MIKLKTLAAVALTAMTVMMPSGSHAQVNVTFVVQSDYSNNFTVVTPGGSDASAVVGTTPYAGLSVKSSVGTGYGYYALYNVPPGPAGNTVPAPPTAPTTFNYTNFKLSATVIFSHYSTGTTNGGLGFLIVNGNANTVHDLDAFFNFNDSPTNGATIRYIESPTLAGSRGTEFQSYSYGTPFVEGVPVTMSLTVSPGTGGSSQLLFTATQGTSVFTSTYTGTGFTLPSSYEVGFRASTARTTETLSNFTLTNLGSGAAQPPSTIPSLYAWWDATSPAGVADASNNPNATNVDHVIDQTGAGNHLYCRIYNGVSAGTFPEVTRVNRMLGALSEVVSQSADHRAEAGRELDGPSVDLGSTKPWTLWLTWTRPRWKFNGGSYPQENSTSSTILIRAGSTDLLTLPGGDPSQLSLFNSTLAVPGAITERHSHSIIIRNTPGTGVAVWLDNVRVITAGANSFPASQIGKLVFLRDGGLYFHDAGLWQRSLTDTEVSSLTGYLGRYAFGTRLEIGQLSMGQSNQGQEVGTYYESGNRVAVPAYLNGYVIANQYGTVAASGVGTIFGGNSLYATGSGTFLKDPGDGSDPSTWTFGAAGTGCVAYFATLSATDKQYLNFVHWLQGESDTTRPASEQPKYEAACKRFMDLIRTALGCTPAQLPWIVPLLQPYGYGNDAGHNLVRRSWVDIANLPGNPYNVYIASRANGDVDCNYGVSNYGDAHMNDLDCKQMAVRDGLAITGIFKTLGYVDDLNIAAPTVGPSIASAQQINSTTVKITVLHDKGTDLTVPASAAGGLGWRVHDGATTIGVTACVKTSPTTLQLTLAAPITGTAPTVAYAEGYGRLAAGNVSGHGNAIYDNSTVPADFPNASILPMPLGLSVFPTPITH